jgi:uncharacterized protein YbjT (DUF2867 family)
MRVLVVGGYGLIGGQVVTALATARHEVIGAGRDVRRAGRQFPFARWEKADLARFSATDWAPLLAGVEVVINCAGALQDGPHDDLSAVHVTGLMTLARAAEAAGVRRLIHVSAAGLAESASAFAHTKRGGEMALASQPVDWLILRPGLVLDGAAFGGSALLRGLAGFPFVTPCAYPDSRIQVVGAQDIAHAVVAALEPSAPKRMAIDLVSTESYELRAILIRLRQWLGLPPARVVSLPMPIAGATAAVADALAMLGWRSPMRSTALAQLRQGVVGDEASAAALPSIRIRNLEQLLIATPSGVQERWFARLYFLKPVGLATLVVFWAVSGLTGLLALDRAAGVLHQAGFGQDIARPATIAGSTADLVLALLVCHRRTAPLSLKAMIALSAVYLLVATVWRPDLWSDPFGPLVKVIPAIVLALMMLGLMEDR